MWGFSYFIFIYFSCLLIFLYANSCFFIFKFFQISSFSLSFLFTWEAFIFNFTLIIIFLSIMHFTNFYLFKNQNLYYNILMMLFGFSMWILIFHSNILLLMIGWDGLGITSYMLVYYYMNWSSINSALVTVLTNRFGDVLLMIFFMQVFFSFNVMSSMMIFLFFIFFIFFAAITKSAQFPFSSWLPMAMAAPTPTSSLVHSSTLVTAGIYLFLKYFFCFLFFYFELFLCVFGFLTILISGLSSLLEYDMKKIIALSTLNQLGLLIFMMSFGNKSIVMFHLISHAFFKSCMFLQVGVFIHSFFSNQDSRVFFYSKNNSFSSTSVFLACLFSICGITFLSGYVSKEMLLFSLLSSSFMLFSFFLFFFIVLFTIFYSFRLFKMTQSKSNFFVFVNKNNFPFFSSLFLFFCGIFFGFWMSENYFFFFSFLIMKEISLIYIFFMFVFFNIVVFFFLFYNNMFFQDAFFKQMKASKSVLKKNNFVDFFIQKNYIFFINNYFILTKMKYSTYFFVFLMFFFIIF